MLHKDPTSHLSLPVLTFHQPLASNLGELPLTTTQIDNSPQRYFLTIGRSSHPKPPGCLDLFHNFAKIPGKLRLMILARVKHRIDIYIGSNPSHLVHRSRATSLRSSTSSGDRSRAPCFQSSRSRFVLLFSLFSVSQPPRHGLCHHFWHPSHHAECPCRVVPALNAQLELLHSPGCPTLRNCSPV